MPRAVCKIKLQNMSPRIPGALSDKKNNVKIMSSTQGSARLFVGLFVDIKIERNLISKSVSYKQGVDWKKNQPQTVIIFNKYLN